jgi:hypothetical protein
MSPAATIARQPDPMALEIAERRRRLGLSRPQVAVLASVALMPLDRMERGVGRALRHDEAELVLRLLTGLERLRAECAGLPLAAKAS